MCGGILRPWLQLASPCSVSGRGGAGPEQYGGLGSGLQRPFSMKPMSPRSSAVCCCSRRMCVSSCACSDSVPSAALPRSSARRQRSCSFSRSMASERRHSRSSSAEWRDPSPWMRESYSFLSCSMRCSRSVTCCSCCRLSSSSCRSRSCRSCARREASSSRRCASEASFRIEPSRASVTWATSSRRCFWELAASCSVRSFSCFTQVTLDWLSLSR
mmetsp:Transcript_46020/g.119052  ORF Transcript_46020/g.119052 Transcript_46020/m.119052 type:complete len:215 (-) Transcript_46020:212-856(-)